MKGKYEREVIAIDFDGTITSKEFHSHNYLIKKGFAPIVRQKGLIVKDKTGAFKTGALKLNKEYNSLEISKYLEELFKENDSFLRQPEKFLLTVRSLIKEGAKIAIVSFNQYPVVVDFVLQKIGFSIEEIKAMNIILGYPKGEQKKVGKGEHLAKLKELTGVTDNKDITLIDDDYTNIYRAEKEGYKTIYAAPNTDYCQKLIGIEEDHKSLFMNSCDSISLNFEDNPKEKGKNSELHKSPSFNFETFKENHEIGKENDKSEANLLEGSFEKLKISKRYSGEINILAGSSEELNLSEENEN